MFARFELFLVFIMLTILDFTGAAFGIMCAFLLSFLIDHINNLLSDDRVDE